MTQSDFIDSHAPIDFDVERGDAWTLPAVRPWEPKPSLWARAWLWLRGALA
jgi:hypothetical protein